MWEPARKRRCAIKTTAVSESLLYARGFLASCGSVPTVNERWASFADANFSITFDRAVPFSYSSGESGTFVAVLGHYVSLNQPGHEHQGLTDVLAQRLDASLDEFYSELEASGGRYACFYGYQGAVHVLNDCTGMRAVYYTTDEDVCVASHSSLLELVSDLRPDPMYAAFVAEAQPKRYNMVFPPGFRTLYENVRVLCPNTRLDLATAESARYFPRQALESTTTEHAVSLAAAHMSDLATKFSQVAPLAVSLTAGLDSRLTLAATRGIKEHVTYFTYVRDRERVNYVDAEIALRLAEQFGLSHRLTLFDYEADQQSAEFQMFEPVAKRNNPHEHFYPLAFAYLGSYPAGRLHVRSNIGEFCRAGFYTPPFDGVVAANRSRLSRMVGFYGVSTRAVRHLYTYTATEEYVNDTGLFDVEALGYDPLMLSYWEHQMGTWHASLLLESDMSHDTVSLFNNRKLLSLFASIPFEDQLSAQAMYDVVTTLWSDALREPVNPPYSDVELSSLTRRHTGLTPIPG